VIERSYRFKGAEGFHVRPATKFTQIASKFKSKVVIRFDDTDFDGKSPLEVMSACIEDGAQFIIQVEGEDEACAIEAIEKTMMEGEDEIFIAMPSGKNSNMVSQQDDKHEEILHAEAADMADEATCTLSGIGAAPGIAIGKAFIFTPLEPKAEKLTVSDVTAELARFDRAVEEVAQDLTNLITGLPEGEQKDLMSAHRELLKDATILDRIRNAVSKDKSNAEFAILETYHELQDKYSNLKNERIRLRVADIQDICYRLFEKLTGVSLRLESVPNDSVVLAKNLLPSDTVQLEPETLRGLITEEGGINSHTAILARSLGIPSIVGAKGVLNQVKSADIILMDGNMGFIWINPSKEIEEIYREKINALKEEEAAYSKYRTMKTKTKDGIKVLIGANLFACKDAALAMKEGAEGVGLFRTEFLYMNSETPPDAESQYKIYRNVLEVMKDNPCTIRTLDAGGDKPIDSLTLPTETNPFLGVRGIRYCLENEDIFREQLRALLMASPYGNLRIMIPMVTLVEEVERTRELLIKEENQLKKEGIPVGKYKLGIMIETPAAALISRQLAKVCDFMSIGSNDLVQYTMAADRGNPNLKKIYSPYHPAVLQLIRLTGEAAQEHNIPLSICGESASDPLLTPLYIAMGIRSLSVAIPAIPKLRSIICQMDLRRYSGLAEEVLELSTAEKVIDKLKEYTLTNEM